VAATPDNQEIRVLGDIQQDSRRMPLRGVTADRDTVRRDGCEGNIERGLRPSLRVEVVRNPGGIEHGGHMPRQHRLDCATSKASLTDSELQGSNGSGRTVQSDHDPADGGHRGAHNNSTSGNERCARGGSK
jgi:hypothetical protein